MDRPKIGIRGAPASARHSQGPKRSIVRKLWKAVAVLSLAGATTLIAGPAQAADSNADFGQHVRMCHNPGMHQGKSGWDHPSHTGMMN